MSFLTGPEMVTILYRHLMLSALMIDAGAPNGGLHKLKRPLYTAEDQVKEDVVINFIASGRDAVQEAVLNVNIYVPNKKLKRADDTVDETQPDTNRMQQLSLLVEQSLNGVVRFDGQYQFTIIGENHDEDEQTKCHIINYRIEFLNQSL